MTPKNIPQISWDYPFNVLHIEIISDRVTRSSVSVSIPRLQYSWGYAIFQKVLLIISANMYPYSNRGQGGSLINYLWVKNLAAYVTKYCVQKLLYQDISTLLKKSRVT
jgi:hypothetical protein